MGGHSYVRTAKEYIDITYPNRHKLIIGDSRLTIPAFLLIKKNTKFDIIFIDGGHDYNIAKKDMENCFHLSHDNTIVILDDTMFTKSWSKNYTIGPTKTWTEHLKQNKIIEIGRKDYSIGKGMSWGKYNKNNNTMPDYSLIAQPVKSKIFDIKTISMIIIIYNNNYR